VEGWEYITVTFSPGVKEALRAAAHERGISLSSALREGAQQFLGEGPALHPHIGRPSTLAAPALPDSDSDFGHWLAGFIDGEGCFELVPLKGGRLYTARFNLTCRDDELETLEAIRKRTGFGSIYRAHNRRSKTKANPVARWSINGKPSVAALIALLDRHPLRAKKARDYAIWREAALLWLAYRGDRFNRAAAPWAEMARLKQEMQAGRAYQPH
jgi:hypothetical protein